MPTPNPAAFDFLLHRASHPAKLFAGPVPDRNQLRLILTAAVRVPDHGKLEPWRLVVIEPAAMPRFAALAEAHARSIGADEVKTAKARGQFDIGKLAVAVIASPQPSEKVPPVEQLLSAGALCLSIVNAATAAGWGANWLSGWPSHDAAFAAAAFGCTPVETIAGIIHIGTPGGAGQDRARPDLDRLISWATP